MRRSRRGVVAALSAGAALTALLTGCQAGTATPAATQAGAAPSVSPSTPETSAAATPDAVPAALTFSIKDGAKDVPPDTPVRVTTDGRLGAVAVKDEDGKAVAGAVGEDGRWSGRLMPKTTYTVTASAANDAGATTTKTSTFTTLTPRITATYRVWPQEGTVGVGMPVMVAFDSPVKGKANRAAVEKAIDLKVTPAQQGSWGWSTSTMLYWRPKLYFKPGTKVTVKAKLAGVKTGEGKWVGEDKAGGFTVGSARISYVNLKTHRMVVKENGKVVADWPISGGKPGRTTVTRSGVKIITEKHSHYVMDSSSYGVKEGDPEYYKTEVDYAMRITNTGEFLHAAPWSVWAQGSQNVSHGCVNMGPRAARRMFNESKIGDVVDTTGSDRQFGPGEGVDVWTYSWADWQKRSAVTGNGGLD